MNIDTFRKPNVLAQNKGNSFKGTNKLHTSHLIHSSNTQQNQQNQNLPLPPSQHTNSPSTSNNNKKSLSRPILTKQESIQAVYHTSSINNSNDQTRQRATSKLVNNFTRQNRYTLGVGVRKMSIVIERPRLPHQVNIFQKAVRSVISLLRQLAKLRSRNSHIVKVSLMKFMNLVQAPQNAGIMNDIGVCEVLIDLLNLDPLNHFQIVGMALHGLKLLALSSECSLKIASNKQFLAIIENFLRSDNSLTQRLAAEIICRCFIQPIHSEHLVMSNNTLLLLLLKCLSLPYRDIQIRVLSILESLTYHCENTAIITKTFESNPQTEFLQGLVDFITENTEKNDDLRYYLFIFYHLLFYYYQLLI